MHNRHSRIIWETSTGALEWWIGLGLMAYAVYLIAPQAEPMPWRVVTRLVPDWLTEPIWGEFLFALGALQWWFSDNRWSWARYIIAVALWLILSYTLVAYWQVGELQRRMVPVMAVLWFAEFWIAWRAFHDKRTANVLMERRNV